MLTFWEDPPVPALTLASGIWLWLPNHTRFRGSDPEPRPVRRWCPLLLILLMGSERDPWPRPAQLLVEEDAEVEEEKCFFWDRAA